MDSNKRPDMETVVRIMTVISDCFPGADEKLQCILKPGAEGMLKIILYETDVSLSLNYLLSC